MQRHELRTGWGRKDPSVSFYSGKQGKRGNTFFIEEEALDAKCQT